MLDESSHVLTQRASDSIQPRQRCALKKIRLLTPGPTPVPERLSLRMARPIVHHRSPEFEAVFARVREGLARLYQTKQDGLVFAASGTGPMEASLGHFPPKGATSRGAERGQFRRPL